MSTRWWRLGALAALAGAACGVDGARDAALAASQASADSPGAAANADDTATAQPPGSGPRCRMGARTIALRHLPEASGVAAGRRNPGVLWSHNDSGEPAILALDTLGRALGKVRIAGAMVEDWEDVAAGPCPTGACLYIGDIGDNRATRRSVTVYRVPEPAVADRSTAAAEAFPATYPDGANDAEALFVSSDGSVYVITKGDTGPVALYRYPQPMRAGVVAILQRVATIHARQPKKSSERITGASASPDGQWVALRTSDAILFFHADDFMAGRFVEASRVDVKRLREPQGEGIALSDDGAVYLVSEGGGRGHPGSLGKVVCRFPPRAGR